MPETPRQATLDPRPGPGALRAWFDGACEPVNPGGIGTWAYVVRGDEGLVASAHGVVGDPRVGTTNNVAEYAALRNLLARIRDEGWQGRPTTVQGDSKLIVLQVRGEWKANKPHLVALRDECRVLLRELPRVRLEHVPRDQNGEADRLTHVAYEEVLDGDVELLNRLHRHIAPPARLEECRRRGIPVYRYMGKEEVERLVARQEGEAPPGQGPTGTMRP